MTNDQWMGVLRFVLGFGGGMAVSKGWLTPADMQVLTDTLLQAAGPVAAAAAAAWSIHANRKASIIKSASAMPEVMAMSISDTSLVIAAKEADASTHVTVAAAQ